MQLLRLEVRNWCQHKHRVCNFTRGLVAIIGKIGSGKSNLLGAICWLLTGENPNSGLKMDNVSQFSGDSETSYATLEFEHAGHTVVVTRHLLPEKEQATLTIDGVEAARGDKAVTAHIERLLGIDSKFMSRFVIVAQNELFAFIEDGATEVDKFFQKLFGTANAERCQDIIGKQLTKLVIPEVPEPSTLLIEKELAVTELIDGLDNKIFALPALETFLKEQARHQKVMQDWQDCSKLSTELAAADVKLAEYDKQLKLATTACEQYAGDLAALQAVIDGSQDAHANAKVAIGHLATYQQLARTREKTAKRLQEIADLQAANLTPVSVPDHQITEFINSEKTIELRLQKASQFIQSFANAGVAECPTCHTPTTNLVGALAEAQQQIPVLGAQLTQAKNQLASAITQRNLYVAWEKQNAALESELAQLTDAACSLPSVAVPDVSEEELVQTIADHEKLQKAKAEIEPLAQKEKERKAGLAGLLSAVNSQKISLSEQLNKFTTTQVDADLAQHALTGLNQQFALRQALEKDRAQTAFARDNLQNQLAQVQADEQKAINLRIWSATAQAAREALKAAPRLVAKRNLQRLELAINELLQVFGVDFFIKAATDESPTFIAEFFDGRKQPAKRLSYGQKTVLALAFRVAVNALFADQIGLLALDEPTAYLDQQRIRALAPVLERLRELSTARGLQCLMVTHETSLSHLFESAVELDT